MPRESASQATFINNFKQFVSIYIRSLRYASAALKNSSQQTDPIDLNVAPQMILSIIQLLNTKKDKVQVGNTLTLEEFAVLLIAPPSPFTNSAVEQVNFAIDTLLSAPQDDYTDAKHQVACLLAC